MFIVDYVSCITLSTRKITQTSLELGWNHTCGVKLNPTQHYVDVIISQEGVVLKMDTYKRDSWNPVASVIGLLPYREYSIKVRVVADGNTSGWESQSEVVLTAQGGL